MTIFASEFYVFHHMAHTPVTEPSRVRAAQPADTPGVRSPSALIGTSRTLIGATLFFWLAMTCESVLCHAESPERTALIVEDIRCKGSALTKCSFIRAFLHISAGDPLNEEEIQNAKLRLSSLPDFLSVQIYLDKGSAKGRAIVVIEVVEADRVENEISAGTSSRLSSLYQTVEARVAERNAFGTEDTLNLDVEGIVPIDGPTHHGIYSRLQFVDPTLLDSNKYFLIGGVSYQNTVISYPYNAFDKTDQLDLDLSVGRRLFDYSYVTVGYLERLISQSISQSRGTSAQGSETAGRSGSIPGGLVLPPERGPHPGPQLERERPEDIPLLAQFFAHRVCEKNNIKVKPMDDEVMSELKRYHWPGNVRELQNIMERVVTMSGERITLLDIPEEIVAVNDLTANRHAGSALREFRDKAERDFILGILRRNLGNISQSAIELGVGRSYLHRRLAVLGIAKKDWFS